MADISSDSQRKPVERNKRSKLAGIAVVCLLLGGILLFAIISTSRSKWHCSPAQPRPSGVKAWEEATAPAQPPSEPNEDFFASFTVSSDEENSVVEYPTRHPPENPFAYEVRRMSPGEPLNIGGGTFTLFALGTAYHDANQTMEDNAIYRFFNPDFKSITPEQAEELKTDTYAWGEYFRHIPVPRIQIGFIHEGIEDAMFQGIRVFDATTKKELTGGYSSSTRHQYHWFDTRVPLWHRTPVEIMIEISYSPSKTFEFAPRAGEGFREGSFECRLISVFENADVNLSSSGSRDNKLIHKIRKAKSDEGGSCFVFACYPSANKMPVTFEFLDVDGNVLLGEGGSTSGFVRHRALKQPLEKVARIRARYRTQRERVLIYLPYIPGLPDQNSAIEDLFDVHIPYVRLHDAGQVGSFLRRTLQLQNSRQTGPVPPNSINSMRFPIEFRDTTLREIAQLYARGGDLEVDIESEQLRLEYPVPLMTS